jgi:hypothetical protein
MSLPLILKFVVQHSQGDHLLAEQMLARNSKWLDVCEYIEAIQGAGNRIGHDLPGQVSDVNTMPGIALRVKYIIGDPTHLRHSVDGNTDGASPGKLKFFAS